MKNTGDQSEPKILRQKAEKLLKKKSLKTASRLSEIETKKLIHELKVHQIELELQNEEVVQAKEQAIVAADKYTDLYNFAPSGYFTLSQDNKIIELNLSGANLLGKTSKSPEKDYKAAHWGEIWRGKVMMNLQLESISFHNMSFKTTFFSVRQYRRKELLISK